MPPRFTDSPNAKSKSITHADGIDTFGVFILYPFASPPPLMHTPTYLQILNRHASKNSSFQIGVAEDKGTRRTMEDAHSFVVDFDTIRGQGFFAVFDGHAGKHAAEWCGAHFHEYLLECIHATPSQAIPNILNETFHKVDASLSQMCEESDGKIHSGCTAVTAFLRIEDTEGKQSFLSANGTSARPESTAYGPGSASPVAHSASSSISNHTEESRSPSPPEASGTATVDVSAVDGSLKKMKKEKKVSGGSRIKKALKSLGSGSISEAISPRSASPVSNRSVPVSRKASSDGMKVCVPPAASRRVLYTANVGDARGVLCRGGKATRLTYDHKGSDKQEAKRIMDAGGFVMSGRVNGVLAVTRSLGDSSMKEFVVGAPYTTETELCEEDEFLILACDGLWDVTSDQAAIDLIRETDDAQHASQKLLKHALSHHTTDNVTVMVVRFKSIIPYTA